MTKKMRAEWQRIAFDNTPIYILPDSPDWFVPNQVADDELVKLLRQEEFPIKG